MGCLVTAGILKPDKTLTDDAKNSYIREVKELLIYGSENLPTPVPFSCGDPLPPANPPLTMEDLPLEDEKLYESFHRDFIKNQYEKIASSLDSDSSFSLLPALADPTALAASFGVDPPVIPFPDGFVPYLTGLLVPKFVLDLLKEGVTDFFIPPLLVPELAKLLSIPSPPVMPPLPPIELPPLVEVPPPPEVPATPGVPSAEFPALPEVPPIPIPVPPTVALADVYLKDLALLEGIPKLIGQIIAEIPKLIAKIANPSEIFSFICGKVRESGMLGQQAPENDLEKAAAIVLARKISACVWFVSVGKTLGCGSLVAGMAESVGYKPPPPPPKKGAPINRDTPSEAVAAYAERLVSITDTGTSYSLSYGNNPSYYVQTLLYQEASLSTLAATTVNALGDYLDPNDPERIPPNGTTRQAIKNSNELKKKYGLENPRAFLVQADYAARDYSSCALLGRALYYRGGAVNKFFLGLYQDSTAVAGLQIVGMLRNYKWIEKSNDGNPVVNPNWQDLRDIIYGFSGTDGYTSLQIQWNETTTRDECIGSSRLDPSWIKPRGERAYLDEYQLGYIAQTTGKFPKLDRGDMILLREQKPPPPVLKKGETAKPQTPASDHLAVVVVDVDPFSLPKDTGAKLQGVRLLTVDGGQMDDLNLGPPVAPGASSGTIENDEVLRKKGTPQFDSKGKQVGVHLPKEYLGGGWFLKRGKDLYSITSRPPQAAPPSNNPGSTEYKDNFTVSPANESTIQKKPTAVLRGDYDYGYYEADYPPGSSKNGFYLAKSELWSSNKGLNFGDSTDPEAPPSGAVRKVIGVFKTKNYLDPLENMDVSLLAEKDQQTASRLIYQNLVKVIDDHPLLTKYYSLAAYNVNAIIDEGFPSLPVGKTD